LYGLREGAAPYCGLSVTGGCTSLLDHMTSGDVVARLFDLGGDIFFIEQKEVDAPDEDPWAWFGDLRLTDCEAEMVNEFGMSHLFRLVSGITSV